MSPLCVYTIFEPRTGKPQCVGIRNNGHTIIEELYTGKNLVGDILKTRTKIGRLIAKAAAKRAVLITDLKEHLKWFDIPLATYQYNIYDLHLSHSVKTLEQMQLVLARMEVQQPRPYQRLIGNAAIVYEDLERRGILINYTPHWPQWNLKTFSGRSSTTNCNIQGWHETTNIRPAGASERNVIIHFDWLAADIRIASLLSGDKQLQESFIKTDPYTVLMKLINAGSKTRLSRKESKEYLLKSINSMDHTSTALTSIYPDLGRWIRSCKSQLVDSAGMPRPTGYLESILGRRFRMRDAIERSVRTKKRPDLVVLNGVMQGSVAHAMQATLRRVWEKLPHNVIAEIHDCLLLSSDPSTSEISAAIKTVVPIMMYPFAGLLPDNPVFPVTVSISKRWKKERVLQIHREGGVVYVKKKQDPKAATDSVTGSEAKAEAVGETG